MAAQEHKLKAEKRTVSGRKVKQLRKQGVLPANVYGKHIESVSIQVATKDFVKLFGEVGETGLITLELGGETRPVLVHEVSREPVMDMPIHVDFLQVNLKEKVTATVPIEFEGESPAEKEGTGIVVPQMREIEVEALPTDLPDHITVDVSGLNQEGDSITVSQLKIDRDKVELKVEDPEQIVVSIAAPAKEEEPEPVVAEGEEGAEGEAPAEGGEAQADGEAAPEGEEKKEE